MSSACQQKATLEQACTPLLVMLGHSQRQWLFAKSAQALSLKQPPGRALLLHCGQELLVIDAIYVCLFCLFIMSTKAAPEMGHSGTVTYLPLRGIIARPGRKPVVSSTS